MSKLVDCITRRIECSQPEMNASFNRGYTFFNFLFEKDVILNVSEFTLPKVVLQCFCTVTVQLFGADNISVG